MGADQLVIGLREDKIADLAARVDCTYGLQSERVPEANVLVSRATPCCQETSVQRTPVDRFYSGLVLRKLAQRLLIVARHHVPDHELVVIATGCKHLMVVRTPSQPTDFLPVTAQMLHETWLSSHIAYENLLVFRATGDKRAWPCTRTDSVLVSSHAAHQLLLLDIPYLHLTIIGPHRQMRTLLRPSYRRDPVAFAKIDQFADAWGVSVPDVDLLGQGHCKRVCTGPVDQVQIEIIAKIRCVEDLVRGRSYLSDFVDQYIVGGDGLRCSRSLSLASRSHWLEMQIAACAATAIDCQVVKSPKWILLLENASRLLLALFKGFYNCARAWFAHAQTLAVLQDFAGEQGTASVWTGCLILLWVEKGCFKVIQRVLLSLQQSLLSRRFYNTRRWPRAVCLVEKTQALHASRFSVDICGQVCLAQPVFLGGACRCREHGAFQEQIIAFQPLLAFLIFGLVSTGLTVNRRCRGLACWYCLILTCRCYFFWSRSLHSL